MPSAIPDQCPCKNRERSPIIIINDRPIVTSKTKSLSTLVKDSCKKKTSVKDYSYKFLSIHKEIYKTRYLAVQHMDGMKLNL
jgi:hypothetical protein